MPYDGDRFPKKPPIEPCMGWLSHNTQTCACYASDRAAERRNKRGFFARLFN